MLEARLQNQPSPVTTGVSPVLSRSVAGVRRFDEHALLDGAQELFWSRGYDQTSVQDVTEATGVSNGSIYAAYGTKLGLFLAVFQRYCDQRAAFVENVVSSTSGSARDVVNAYFEAIIADCAAQPNRRGCLMINSIAQLAHRIPEVVTIADKSTRRMEASVAARLSTGRDDESARDDARTSLLSAHIVLISQGFIQLSRLGATRERLRELADVASGLAVA
jgi:AcrR family transcriptional regulator